MTTKSGNQTFKYGLPIQSRAHATWCKEEACRRYNGKLHRHAGRLGVMDDNQMFFSEDVLVAASSYKDTKEILEQMTYTDDSPAESESSHPPDKELKLGQFRMTDIEPGEEIEVRDPSDLKFERIAEELIPLVTARLAAGYMMNEDLAFLPEKAVVLSILAANILKIPQAKLKPEEAVGLTARLLTLFELLEKVIARELECAKTIVWAA